MRGPKAVGNDELHRSPDRLGRRVARSARADSFQKDLDIVEYTDPTHNPMIPHVVVLEPGLVVHKIYNGYWFFGRPSMEELRMDLRAVSAKCRPDWDITTPELKAAWQEGRKRAPWFAWFFAAFFATFVIRGILVAVTGSTAESVDDSIGWILLFSVAGGLAVMFLMSRSGTSAHEGGER